MGWRVAILAVGLLVLGSCSQVIPVLYLVNRSGGLIRVVHATNAEQRQQTLAWWGDPWSYFALIGDRRGHDLLSSGFSDRPRWLIEIGARGCRSWYEIPSPQAGFRGNYYFVVRMERDLRLYHVSGDEPLNDALANDAPQPEGFPIGPSGRDCGFHFF